MQGGSHHPTGELGDAPYDSDATVPQAPALGMAIELSLATWKLAFTVGSGQKARIHLRRARSFA